MEPPLSPFPPLSPMRGPHCPPLPKVSLMLMCKKFLEMLPFLFRSNLSTGGSPVAKQFRMPWLIFHLSPQADCPGTSRLPSPPHAGGGVLLGPDAEAPGAERCAERPPDARVRRAGRAGCASGSPGPFHCRVPMSQATATRTSLIPQHQHSSLGVVAAVTHPGSILAHYHRIALRPVELAL